MRIAYFDCFSGASGDMILAACLNAGLDLGTLREQLALLGVEGYRIDAAPVRKQGFAANQFEVICDPDTAKPHRHLKHIIEILERSTLPERIRRRAAAIFTRLAEAEAAVHGTTIEKVHFHEVGAIDAIVDIVGVCAGITELGIEQLYASPLPLGHGWANTQHGKIPLPAPARWHSEGWTGAVIDYAELRRAAEPEALIEATLGALHRALAPYLMEQRQ